MAAPSVFFASLAFVLFIGSNLAFADEGSCKSLEPKILECSSSTSRGSIPRRCCQLADQYVRRLGCSEQAEVGREIIRSCEEEEERQDEFEGLWSFYNQRDSRECRELESKLQQCSRSPGSTPQECCRVARQYVHQLRCSRSAETGRQIIRSCQEQEEEEEREERREHEILSFILGDSKECRDLEPRLRECSRSTGSTSPECCRLAEEYVHELRCSRRADAGKDILRSCEEQRQEEFQAEKDSQECMEMEPRLESCARPRGQISRECCEVAEEYTHRLGCTRRADAGRRIIRRCQEEQQEEKPFFNKFGQERQECRRLESKLQQCARDSGSRQCCRMAKEYVDEYGCTPRSDRVRKMIQDCEEEQADSLKIRKYGFFGF